MLSYVAGPGEAAVLSSWSSSPSTVWLAASSLSVDCGWRTGLADESFTQHVSLHLPKSSTLQDPSFQARLIFQYFSGT